MADLALELLGNLKRVAFKSETYGGPSPIGRAHFDSAEICDHKIHARRRMIKLLGVMRCNVPKRYSLQWWSWIASGTLLFGSCTGLFLYWEGSISGLNFLLLVVVGSFVGDLALALAFEAVVPTRVVIGPGDRINRGSAIKETARIISGFENSGQGKVIVRGEVWKARCVSDQSCSFAIGENVRVLGREGLTLLIGDRE